jgi:signal transduction histidine kinase
MSWAPRLFQPFFSTKEHRQGLSLSRAKRYVEFHGGTLELIQSGEKGASFQLELPIKMTALHHGRPVPMLEA